MKSMVRIAVGLLEELGGKYGVRTDRDVETLTSRFDAEGLSFLTITLPNMEKELTRSVSSGVISHNLLALMGSAGGAPRFLGGFLEKIFFDGTNVSGYEEFRGSVFRDLRQLLVLFSKVDVDCTPVRKERSLEQYISTDRMIPTLHKELLDEFARESMTLWHYLLQVEQLLEVDDLGRHSSGALATRESYNSRFHLNTWSARLQKVWPYWHYARCSYNNPAPRIIPPALEPPVKVVLVPKTQKSPRVIAMEPVYNQFAQQGILSALTQVLSTESHVGLYKSICWDDQSYNRRLAFVGASEGNFATIDLSEASDRVSSTLVHAMLPPGPLRDAVFASRSRYADVQGRKIRLRKFASMGSSLCFPMESMVFYIIARMGVQRAFGVKSGSHDLPIRVYGDDIIVPTDSAPEVIRLLEAYGLKINPNKTFLDGKFRESCGADWYGATDVTPVRSRMPLPNISHHDARMVSVIEWHNDLYERGYYATCSEIRSVYNLDRYPTKHAHQTNITGVISHVRWPETRFNSELQRTEQRALFVRGRNAPDNLDGYPALEKFFRMRGVEPLQEGHLESDGRPLSLVLKTGWTGLHSQILEGRVNSTYTSVE